jgi:transcription factor C subunit 3
MTLGTPAERYRASQGFLILESVGQKVVGEAGRSMVSRGVLSKLIRDPQRPGLGRYFKISDM